METVRITPLGNYDHNIDLQIPDEMKYLFEVVLHQIRIQKEIRNNYNWPDSGEIRLFSHSSYDKACVDLSNRSIQVYMKPVLDIIQSIFRRNKLLSTISNDMKFSSTHKKIDMYNYCSNTENLWRLNSSDRDICIDCCDITDTIDRLLDEMNLHVCRLSDQTYSFIHDISNAVKTNGTVYTYEGLTDVTKRCIDMTKSSKYTMEDVVYSVTTCDKERVFLSRLLLVHLKMDQKIFLNCIYMCIFI